jgi:hypothetical protein
MKVTFKNVKLRKFCEAKSSSKKLRTRLADLGAVESMQDLVYGKPHPHKRRSRRTVCFISGRC